MAGFAVIPGGPAIPLEVVGALENERLVIFCGAGISIGTGLPDFKKLTLDAIAKLDNVADGCPTDPALRDAFCTQQYDKALDILERNTAGNALRDYVAGRLTEQPSGDPDLPLHKAILTLAKRRNAPNGGLRGYRLVTTNYDDRFELAGLEHDWIESAPHLARPRGDDERASYATFLHGRIETKARKRDPRNRELVLTSADFGNAYMRDGFATRFVLELFREFTVLFIGYGINDPVMRYLVDIFATERLDQRKGQFNDAYAITSFENGQEPQIRALWLAKNVTPILYDAADGRRGLIDLMTAWARLHSAGADGRFAKFLEITREPYGAGAEAGYLPTAAWALADKHFRTAERLASLAARQLPTHGEDEQDKSASTQVQDSHISWLGPLLQAEVLDPRDERRPRKPCKLFDIPDVSAELCRWAMRHLETRELVDWAIDNERLLMSTLREPFFGALIRRLHRQGELPPVAAPHRTFWEALVEIAVRFNSTRDWRSLFHPGTVERGTPESLMRFIHQSEVGIAWPSKPWRWVDELEDEAQGLSRLARFELAGLGDRDNLQRLRDLFADPADRAKARDDLAPYLDDLTSLLLAICRLGRMIEAPFATGWSIDERPSMLPEESNNLEHADLSWLIEAIVLSFASAAADDANNAVAAALRWRLLWRRESFSLFGRLYMHAAVVLPGQIAANVLVDDLLDPPEVLWSAEYRAEVLPVLRLRIAEASRERQQSLIDRLLEPPPSGLFREDRDEVIERFRGQRLAWLQLGGGSLDEEAISLVDAYLAENPPSEDPRADEVFYIRHTTRVGAIGIGPSLVGQPFEVILESLSATHDAEGWPINEWDRAKRVDGWLRQEPMRTTATLEAFARKPDLPDGVLNGIFQAVCSFEAENATHADAAASAIELVVQNAERLVTPNATAVASWLRRLASWPESTIDNARFFRLWDCTIGHAPQDEAPAADEAHLNSAINAVGGILAEALRDRFWQTKPRAGQGLPGLFRSRFERLIRGDSLASLHARLVCMQALDALFAVDPDWTRRHLLTRLAWLGDFADQAAWHWQAHLCYGPWGLELSRAYHADFLKTLGASIDRDSDTFRIACQRFAALGATYAFFSEQDTRQGFRAIEPKGAAIVLDTLRRRLIESTTPADMWQNMIGPWLSDHWPAATGFAEEPIPNAVAKLIIETDEAFADALGWAEPRGLIQPFAKRYDILGRLSRDEHDDAPQNKLAEKCPNELTRFLSQIFRDQQLVPYERDELGSILYRIEASPNYEPARTAALVAQLRRL